MKKPVKQLALSAALLSVLSAAPAAAQTSQMATPNQPIVTGTLNNIKLDLYKDYPLDQVKPLANTVTISWPQGMSYVNAEREDDGRYKIFLRGTAATGDLFNYYRRLLAAQGYQLVSVENDANAEAFWPWLNDFDAQYVSGNFVRAQHPAPVILNEYGVYVAPYAGAFAGDRLGLLVDRESADTFAVYLDPKAYAGAAGVYEAPLYYGVYNNFPYGFYGPVGYPGYQALPADKTRLRLVAPAGARDFHAVHFGGDTFVYRFGSDQELGQIADLYDQVLTNQGFQKVSGNLQSGLDTFVYAKGDQRLGLNIRAIATNRYQVKFDLTPAS